jgi:hypothetical protein
LLPLTSDVPVAVLLEAFLACAPQHAAPPPRKNKKDVGVPPCGAHCCQLSCKHTLTTWSEQLNQEKKKRDYPKRGGEDFQCCNSSKPVEAHSSTQHEDLMPNKETHTHLHPQEHKQDKGALLGSRTHKRETSYQGGGCSLVAELKKKQNMEQNFFIVKCSVAMGQ